MCIEKERTCFLNIAFLFLRGAVVVFVWQAARALALKVRTIGALCVSNSKLFKIELLHIAKMSSMELDEAAREGTLLGEKNDNLHFIEKYRPNGLDELIGQGDIVSTREICALKLRL